MSDLIDRWMAIELIHSLYPSAPIMRMNRERWKEKYKPYIEAEKALEMLPSAQPEQRWIPCSEWLPEQGARVLTCSKDGNIWINDYNPIAPTAWAIEPWAVIAWMPLPESYKEGQDE